MGKFDEELIALLSTDLFLNLINSGKIKINQIFTLQRLLIKADIPFDFQFSPGTRRASSGAQFIIFLNPSTSIKLDISFESGGTIFDMPE